MPETYTYCNMDDLIEVCVPNMVNENFTEEQARVYPKQSLPKLDYWKRHEELKFMVDQTTYPGNQLE